MASFAPFGVLVGLLLVPGCGPPPPPEPTACAADAYEPNGTMTTAFELPPMQDHPDSLVDVVDLSAHMTNDEDWFKVHVDDSGAGGDPVITVTVPSTRFNLTAWYSCDGDRAESLACETGAATNESPGDAQPFLSGCESVDVPSATDERGHTIPAAAVLRMTTDCSGTASDHGTLYVRVRYRDFGTGTGNDACTYPLHVTIE